MIINLILELVCDTGDTKLRYLLTVTEQTLCFCTVSSAINYDARWQTKPIKKPLFCSYKVLPLWISHFIRIWSTSKQTCSAGLIFMWQSTLIVCLYIFETINPNYNTVNKTMLKVRSENCKANNYSQFVKVYVISLLYICFKITVHNTKKFWLKSLIFLHLFSKHMTFSLKCASWLLNYLTVVKYLVDGCRCTTVYTMQVQYMYLINIDHRVLRKTETIINGLYTHSDFISTYCWINQIIMVTTDVIIDNLATATMALFCYPALFLSVVLLGVLSTKKYARNKNDEHSAFYLIMISVSVRF